MDQRDRQAIQDLFARLAEVERRSAPRDPEAEAMIRSAVSAQPGAPYYMAQTIVVQTQALEAARERIEELERNSGRLFGGLFGNSRDAGAGRRHQQADRAQPWASQGSGFLAGAAQTAIGVAGGVLLGNMIAGALFGGQEQAQAEPNADADANADIGGDAETGGEFDTADIGGGDFDFGGDF
jgi:hypothetical protein